MLTDNEPFHLTLIFRNNIFFTWYEKKTFLKVLKSQKYTNTNWKRLKPIFYLKKNFLHKKLQLGKCGAESLTYPHIRFRYFFIRVFPTAMIWTKRPNILSLSFLVFSSKIPWNFGQYLFSDFFPTLSTYYDPSKLTHFLPPRWPSYAQYPVYNNISMLMANT